MPSTFLQRACFLLLAIFAAAAPTAAAAAPTAHQLPDATHARSLTPTAEGTVWFIPSRGSEWESQAYPVLGNLAPDGSVTEREVAGFGAISHLALGPADEVWVAGYGSEGDYGRRPIVIGRLSPSATLAETYTVGRQGWIRSLAIAEDAVWFVHDRAGAAETIERIAIDGTSAQQFSLRPRCNATAVAVAESGSLWFAEACPQSRKGARSNLGQDSINRITPAGKIVRRPLPGAQGYPISLTIGADGTVWFGVSYSDLRTRTVGRITKAGSLALYPIPDGLPFSIAVGPGRRLWFQSSFGGWNFRALNSIGIGGRIGKPICADPTCSLEPTELVAAADDSLRYALARPNLNTGGGGNGLYIGNEIANEAGYIGKLMP
jgi:streptogramin lyase